MSAGFLFARSRGAHSFGAAASLCPGPLPWPGTPPYACIAPPRRHIAAGADDMERDTLLSVLPGDLSASLIRQADTVALAPDQRLFAAGDPCDGCYHVIEGLLKVTVAVPPRHERILAILGPGGFIG